MSPAVLTVPVFGGGVVLEGSSDAQRTDELRACDSYDIGPRGQLVVTSDVSNYLSALTSGGGSALTPVYGLAVIAHPQSPRVVCVGASGGNVYVSFIEVNGGAIGGASQGAVPTDGVLVTFASFPIVKDAKQRRLVLIAIAPRLHINPKSGLGLFAMLYDPAGPSYATSAMTAYDALGTGTSGEFAGGTTAVQLYPRGVVAYNNHAWLWGFDNHDSSLGDGANRMMFSNLGNPLKYGNDPDAQAIAEGITAESNRAFEDSDAITIGGAGEAIRAAYAWRGKLWVGTNRELHYIEGYGRDSFLTNGALKIAQSRNVIGPRAMIEGPDGLLYGVSDEGLWAFNGGAVDPVGDKLRDFHSHSLHWWDLIWTDTSRAAGFPGKSNADLVWMYADTEAKQVWVGIPYCNAGAGSGFGSDTVVLKYHVATGGFTRQAFTGKLFFGADQIKRDGLTITQRFIASDTAGGATNVRNYAAKATLTTSPVLPTALPAVTFGEYAPFGPTGIGVLRKRYLTIAWETSAGGGFPIIFELTPTIDGEAYGTVKLTIGGTQPVAPANGDVWVDMTGADTNLGNGGTSSIIPSHGADYLIRTYVTTWAKWVQAGGGGQGKRITIPLAFVAARGTRLTVACNATAVPQRFQIEGFSELPAKVEDAA